MMNKNFYELLDELWWLSDQKEPMIQLCNFMEYFAKEMKGKAIAKVVDPHDYGFPYGQLYILFDDLCGNGVQIYEGGDFIRLIQSVYADTFEDEWKLMWSMEIQNILYEFYN